ncbi:MAG TPA: triose-phosphate isomerase [Candidatus Paceibacterota bacterium]
MKKNKKVLLVGNWKMNPVTLADARKRFAAIKKSAQAHKGFDVAICPPFPFIAPLAEMSGKGKIKVAVGAQDVSSFEEGLSKTGEVGAQMVASTGASYAIVGHSERRQLGDNGQTIALKVQQVLKTKMQPIVCIGEKERDTDGGYLEIIKAQIKEALSTVSRSQFHEVIVAYEPVWAIGRKDNVAITSYDLHQMVVYIKKCIREMWGETISSMTKILYGGSVTADNAEDIIVNGEVDGLLIGRASWDAKSFGEIFDVLGKGEKTNSKKALKKSFTKAKNNKKNAAKRK